MWKKTKKLHSDSLCLATHKCAVCGGLCYSCTGWPLYLDDSLVIRDIKDKKKLLYILTTELYASLFRFTHSMLSWKSKHWAYEESCANFNCKSFCSDWKCGALLGMAMRDPQLPSQRHWFTFFLVLSYDWLNNVTLLLSWESYENYVAYLRSWNHLLTPYIIFCVFASP